MRSEPKIIFLDAVGTLFGVRGSVGEAYAKIASEFEVEVVARDINKAFIQSFITAPRMAFPEVEASEIPKQEYQWWKAIAVQTFTQTDSIQKFQDFEQFFQRLYAYFAGADPWFVYEDVLPALTNWQGQGIEMGIISNFDSRIYPVLKALDLERFFTSFTISTEVGAAKPDVKIFRHGLTKYARIEGENSSFQHQIWHIGDSFTEDYQGAIAAGLNAFWLDRDRTKTHPTPEGKSITSLKDLVFPA
ncbi:HAD-IA family hydrolase [Tumidithrix elongata RA019]|uniref:HAD-IA family hydrolase n=1 Tax=Tumidithrix elongata BACA0141 TaxID=2716417 RepID=A0AAW9PVB9_9CYAN|nr:HAD-IA family hydrolase [Tumidithrix elongata RA019]